MDWYRITKKEGVKGVEDGETGNPTSSFSFFLSLLYPYPVLSFSIFS